MPYTVFALKWRPHNFDEIIGQKHIVATFKNAIEKNRLAHAYLFSGPRGVGKTSMARILAKALNCQAGPSVNPCQKCPSCVDITQGRSFDVIEIDGASNRGIEEVRVLRENVKFPPVAGKFKIYIIDEVHMLTQEAFNALLKTLEEPPAFVKFIFATTQPNKVPPTIVSRCQHFDFRRISVIEIIAQLEKIATKEEIGIDKEVFFAVAKSSDGSLRDAESLLDQLVSFSKARISLQDVVSVLGIVEQEALFTISDRIIQKDAKGALELLNTVIDEGKDSNILLANLIEHFRNLMIAKITNADSKLIDLPQEVCDRLLNQAQSFSLEEIFGIFNILVNAQEMSKRLDSSRIPLEISLVKLAHDKRGSASSSPHVSGTHNKQAQDNDSSRLDNKDGKVADKAAAMGKNSNITPLTGQGGVADTGNPASLDKVKAVWHDVINAIGKVKMSVATFLSEGNPVKLEDKVLTVAFPKSCSLHKESLDRRENKAIVEQFISDCSKTKLKVNFILSKEITHTEDNADNPLIKSALNVFGARVIKE